jgi:hypothetical protein
MFLETSTRTYPEIAKILRRPTKSIQQKANKLGLNRNTHLPTYSLRWHKYKQTFYPEIYFGDYCQATANQVLPTIQQYNPTIKTTSRGWKRLAIEAHPDIYNYIKDHPDDPRPKMQETKKQIINWLRSRLTETGVAARLEND